MGIRAAAQKLNINVSTAQGWVSKNNKDPQEHIQMSSGNGRPVGRPPVLIDEHKNYIIQWADENTDSVVLEYMLDALTEKFGYLQITRSGFYKFVMQKCRITFKKTHLQPIERNTPEKIEQRYEWVKRWMETDLDFTSNCVFIDEAAFHINLKRSFSWSKEGSRAVVKEPRTRAKTIPILGAIFSFRRCEYKSKESNNGGTVTGHYFNFISNVLDVMDRYEQFCGHYLVMDNAPIHTHEDIQKHIESCGYGCVKLKREQLLDEETLTTRIADACNRILYSDLQGFCRYSASKFDDCLNLELESTKPKSATPTKILSKLEDKVLEELNQNSGEANFDIDNFKNIWSRRIVLLRKEHNLNDFKMQISEKLWSKIIKNKATISATEKTEEMTSTIRRSSRSSTSSLSYLRLLDADNRAEFDKVFNNINNKWVLKSGRNVEDLMYEKIKDFKYEHLGHSFVLDVTDDIWRNVFKKEEIEEIEEVTNSNEFYNELPKRLVELLQKLNGKKTFQEIYLEFKDVKVDRYEDPELYWVKTSTLEFTYLLYCSNGIEVETEQDLLDDVFGFVKKRPGH
ncbi:hypothetical protein G6F43_006164 [Rhizopus delemar]|nr:hypothetical protein G6F43_006164 [Rhizopus delemar]